MYPPTSCASLPNLFEDDTLHSGPSVGWLINCLYFRTSSPSNTALASLASGLIGEASLYMLCGVHCNPLALEADSKVRAAIDAHLDLVFLAGESLFPMMLVLFRAMTSLATLLGGLASGGSGSDGLASWNIG